jgi:hypothetical protein
MTNGLNPRPVKEPMFDIGALPVDFDPGAALASYPLVRKEYNRIVGCTRLHATKRRMLKNVIWVLVQLAATGTKDFTPSVVGHWTRSLNGPSPAALSNKTSADYRTLMTAMTLEMRGMDPQKPKSDGKSGAYDHVLSGIADPFTRQIYLMLIRENTSLKNQVNMLKNGIRVGGTKLNTAALATEIVASQKPPFRLSEAQLQALHSVVEAVHTGTRGLHVNRHGAIVDEFNIEVAPPGFLDALQIILNAVTP